MPTLVELCGTASFAYIGPGVGIGMLSALIGLGLSAGGAVLMTLAYPLRRAWRRLRGIEAPSTEREPIG